MMLAATVIGALLAAVLGGIEPPSGPDSGVTGNVAGAGGDAGLPAEHSPAAGPAISAAQAADRLAQMRASRDAERLAQEQAAPLFVAPLVGRLTSTFGMRWGTMHWGVDIAAPMLTPEYAAADGVVTRAGPESGFGNAVYIQLETGEVLVYGHMETVLVETGQIVRAGDLVAEVGSRGYSTGPHLHFEVYQRGLEGDRVDPVGWLADRGVPV